MEDYLKKENVSSEIFMGFGRMGFLKHELLILSLELNLCCRARHAICSEVISATSQSRQICVQTS